MSAARSRIPEFPGGLEWFNVDAPVRLAGLRGRVLLIYFGSFSSIQCLHVLEDLAGLANRYRRDLTVLGVHSPQFPAEARRSHVEKMLARYHVRYAVIHDPELRLSAQFGIRHWPCQLLADRDGFIVGALSGDGKRARLQQVIEYQISRQSRYRAVGSERPENTPDTEPQTLLSFPGSVLVSRDHVYISDSAHNQIIVTSRQGYILQRYGSTGAGFIDGEGTSASFCNPQGMALNEQFLYVADTGNHAVRRINLRTDEVTTVAGTGMPGMAFESSSLRPEKMRLNSPIGLAMENGTLFIAMAGMHQIWALSLLSNSIKVFSGSGRAGLRDGPPDRAEFAQPTGLAVYGRHLYAVDSISSAIRCIDLDNGSVTTVAGTGLYEYGNADGVRATARLQYPTAIAADLEHRMLWVSDTYNNKIRRVGVKTWHVSSVIMDRQLNEPGGLAFQGGTLYIANTNAHEILCLDPDRGHAEPLNVAEDYIRV